jgi:hypothetical protein
MNNLNKIEKQFRDSLSNMEVKGQRKSADLWNSVEGNLESKSRKRIGLLLIAAAGFALLGVVIYFSIQKQENIKASGVDQHEINSNSSDIKDTKRSQGSSAKENTDTAETSHAENLNTNPNSATTNSSADSESNNSLSAIDNKANPNNPKANNNIAAKKSESKQNVQSRNSEKLPDNFNTKKSISDSEVKATTKGASENLPSSIGHIPESALAKKSSGPKKNSDKNVAPSKENQPNNNNESDSPNNDSDGKINPTDSPLSTLKESYSPNAIGFRRTVFQIPSGNLAHAVPMPVPDMRRPNDNPDSTLIKKPLIIGLTYIPELYWMKKTDLTHLAPLYSSNANAFLQFRKEKLYFQTGLGLSKMSYEFNYHNTTYEQKHLQNVLVGVRVDTTGILIEEIRVDTTIRVTTTRDIKFNNSYARIRLSSETGRNYSMGKSLFQYGIGVHIDYIFNQRGRYVNQNNEPLPNISNSKDGMKKVTFTPYLTSRIIVPLSSSWSVFGGLQISYLPSFNWNKSLNNQGIGAGLQLGIIKRF